MKNSKFAFAAVLLLVIAAAGMAHAQRSEAALIDTYVKTVNRAIKPKKGPDVIFADVSNYENNEKAKWRRFASEKLLEKHREAAETYTTAYVWRRNGRVTATNFTLSSPSGDWAKYVFSYFREDGTLAKAAIDYRTFMGDLKILQDIYFDHRGKVIKKTQRFYDLQTNKPKKVTGEMLGVNTAMLDEVDHFMAVGKLPFADLLTKK